MNIKCLLGSHDWFFCQCRQCGKKRNKGHDWSQNCEICEKCGLVRQNAHTWDGCKCTLCGNHRNIEHDWSRDCETCAKCGSTSIGSHEWKNCTCVKCGLIRHDWSVENLQCKKCGTPRPNCFTEISRALDEQYKDEIREAEREIAQIRSGGMPGNQFTSLAAMHMSLESQRANDQRNLSKIEPSNISWKSCSGWNPIRGYQCPSRWIITHDNNNDMAYPGDARWEDIGDQRFAFPSLLLTYCKTRELANAADEYMQDNNHIVESFFNMHRNIVPSPAENYCNPFHVLRCERIVLPQYSNRAIRIHFMAMGLTPYSAHLLGLLLVVKRGGDIFVLRGLCTDQDWNAMNPIFSYAVMSLKVT